MDQFSIRYARTSDGVSIAWASAGSGPPIVLMPAVPYGNVQLTPRVVPHIYEALCHAGEVYWYDARGTGMSDRSAVDFSVEAMMRDFEAVVSRIEGPFTVVGVASGGRLALAAGASYQDSVARIIVGEIWGWRGDPSDTPVGRMEQAIRGQDPALYARTVAQLLFSFAPAELAEGLAAYIAQGCEPEVLLQGIQANDEQDIRPLLGNITQPVLVTHSRNNQWVPVSAAQELVGSLPNAELALVDDQFYSDSTAHWLRFLGSEPHTTARAPSFRTIVFTDVEGHSQIMSRLGDAKGRAVLREHERLTRASLGQHSGSEVKSLGDGFMASFSSAQAAVDCVRDIQRAFSEPVLGERVRVRIGVNAGEPVAEGDDLFGASVIAAARISARAEGGQVLVANVVRELVAGKGFLFEDRGEHTLSGVAEPVRLWELRWE